MDSILIILMLVAIVFIGAAAGRYRDAE